MAEQDEGIQLDDPSKEEEEIEETVPKENRSHIYTRTSDSEINSLYDKWKEGMLIIQSDFQRHFVWDRPKASRLIESAFLEIPLPTIYLSQEEDGKEYVIDGQQRLTAFFSFIDNDWPGGSGFKLTGLTEFEEFNGKKYSDLDKKFRNKVRYCTVRTITFLKGSDSALKFKIFERLNTGSVSLNDQELRNCLYRGPFNKLLKEMAGDPDFMRLLGFSKPDKRMKDVELVLRFAAFHHQTYLKYKPPMKTFLRQEMEDYQFISDSAADKLKASFKNAISIIFSLLEEHAFKRYYKGKDSNKPDGWWEPKKVNTSLYDILMDSFSKADKRSVQQNFDAVRESLIYLMTSDQEFIEAIERGTSNVKAVTIRFDKWRLMLQDIIGIGAKEPRCFSLSLKEEMYDRDPTCEICHQRIHSLDDSTLDHIEQFWRGGKTVPENARLTHRYCNVARPRND